MKIPHVHTPRTEYPQRETTSRPKRLAAGFEERGHGVSILENCEARQCREAAEQVRDLHLDLVFIMHAWRCAAVFYTIKLEMNLPVIVSLRGTDISEMLDDTEKGPVILSVLERCDGIAVFSETARKKVVRRPARLGGQKQRSFRTASPFPPPGSTTGKNSALTAMLL